MITLIPHKDNPHKSRRLIGILFITIISAIAAYFFAWPHEENFYAQINTEAKKLANVYSTQAQTSESVKMENSDQSQENKNDEIISVAQQQLDSNAVPIPDSEKVAVTLEEAQMPILPVVRDKDPIKRLEEAKIYAKPQITEGKYIDISLAHQNMVLFEDGKMIDVYLISSGKRGMETPKGTFNLQNKVPRAWSKKYGLFMPNWMALVPSGEYGIHELPEWPGGYKEGANHLGFPVSHGCVRLGAGSAKRVYDWAELGTTVVVH